MYSIADRPSFDALEWLLEDMRKKTDEDPIIFIIENKIDLSDERVVGYKEGMEKALSIGARLHEMSAMEDIGISELFDDIMKECFSLECTKVPASPLDAVESSSPIKKRCL